mmetsp:Transcript_21241/g.46301  ORF Transcript_21241/g.46301 Transcript_21241/m.46301 type:complete len:95 (+) Transcript_21241:90-374(+)
MHIYVMYTYTSICIAYKCIQAALALAVKEFLAEATLENEFLATLVNDPLADDAVDRTLLLPLLLWSFSVLSFALLHNSSSCWLYRFSILSIVLT